MDICFLCLRVRFVRPPVFFTLRRLTTDGCLGFNGAWDITRTPVVGVLVLVYEGNLFVPIMSELAI